eukprot:COSAG02_NODE_5108_length_4621_cov_2.302300_2_plen_314_part_00
MLECLGPENCPGLNCETDWDACITDDSMSCHDWWPLLDAAEQTKVKDLCEATELDVDERTGLDPPVERSGKFNLYEIEGTKYRYAVDVEIKRTFYHGSPGTYKDVSDDDLRKRVERLVSEKCRYGGAYYKLTHYGTDVESSDADACDELRDKTLGKSTARWLRQDGLDGWFWGMLGQPHHGLLTTPLLLPWELDRCSTLPCSGQCIAVTADPSGEDCAATSAYWPVRMFGRLITGVVVPVAMLLLLLYMVGSMEVCCRKCPKVCRDRRTKLIEARRVCCFKSQRWWRQFQKASTYVQVVTVFALVMLLFFFSQ